MQKRTSLAKRIHSYVNGLPYKLFYFMFYAGYMPLLLYLPVYFKHIGLSPVKVGFLSGIRPIIQSVGTPVLITVSEKFRSKKLLLVMSSIVMIAKVLIILLFLRPQHQVCENVYLNESGEIIQTSSQPIHHELTKRVYTGEVLRQKDSDDFTMENLGSNSTLSKKLFQKSETTINSHGTSVSSSNNTNQVHQNGSTITLLQTAVPPTLATTKSTTNQITSNYHIVNDEGEVHRIFIALLILVILTDCFDSAIFTLVDHSCVANKNIENYGLIRLWGNVGWGIMTPVIGVVIHHFSHEFCGRIAGSFHYMFFFFIGFTYVALLVGSHLDFETDPNDAIASKVHDVQDNFQYGIFLFASAYSGFCNGFLFTFVNWFIDSLGGNALIMGIATVCKCIVDVALFFFLGKIIELWGHLATTGIGFVGYILVFLVYYFINQAWLVVFAEIIHAIFYALMTSTSVAFLIFAAPAGSSPKMQGILQGIYWGFGTGCGAIFGGYCVQNVGFKRTFLSFTVITCVVAFVFLVIQFLSHVNNPDRVMNDSLSESSSDFDADDEEDFSNEESEQGDLESHKLLKTN